MSAGYSDRYKTIGQAIKKKRIDAGLTQEELSEKAAISISYLTKIEAPNTKKAFSLEVVFAISDALGVSITELLKDV
jgi:transcriptional regulator with XRE-family HTH domain